MQQQREITQPRAGGEKTVNCQAHQSALPPDKFIDLILDNNLFFPINHQINIGRSFFLGVPVTRIRFEQY